MQDNNYQYNQTEPKQSGAYDCSNGTNSQYYQNAQYNAYYQNGQYQSQYQNNQYYQRSISSIKIRNTAMRPRHSRSMQILKISCQTQKYSE